MVGTKTLYLMRHAKSSWDDPKLEDHERPLSKRGRTDAAAMAEYMERASIEPDIVLCSTALRAKETLSPIAKRLRPPKVVFSAAIYEAPERKLWQQLWKLPEDAEAVLMVGHSPGVHELALALAGPESRAKLPPIEGKFPTGTVAALSFVGTWKSLCPRGATVISLIRPKELRAAKR